MHACGVRYRVGWWRSRRAGTTWAAVATGTPVTPPVCLVGNEIWVRGATIEGKARRVAGMLTSCACRLSHTTGNGMGASCPGAYTGPRVR